ncbi:hypothetical protein CFOL_v3_04284 [Cephalotus follicularis]|uniref:Gag_pre-integrs domain-containing protein n=1 Tax=Cephalotus follicularis TaxID=3775 RepID=A0A1Q3AYP1_CEPFO|nr:hypothetical protein CFOL_v3_04284 [Cephalotus follicularis]
MSPLPTLGQAYSLINQEESDRGIISMTGSYIACHNDSHAAFLSKIYKGKNNVTQEGIKCEYCHWSGHTKENCYKLIGYPPGHRLYKGKKDSPSNGNQKFQRGGENQKHAVNNSIVEPESSPSPAPASAVMFTPDQYQQIMKLLSREMDAESTEQTANVAGIFANLMTICTNDV